MKKYYLTAIAILAAQAICAQTQHTINLSSEIEVNSIIPDEIKPIRLPLDTITTPDKYTNIILYDNFSWEYLRLSPPKIDDATIYDEYWDTTIIHAYKSYPAAQIPDEVELVLKDETHNYCAPITGRVYSGYKFRRTREHMGLDIPLTTGDPIYAAFDGVVRYTGTTRQTGGYGNLVVIRHSNGLETYYGHLSKRNVAPGDVVRAGDVVGLGGSTGRSTGPHLHFEVRFKGQTFDPERLINFSTGELREPVFLLKKHYFSIYSHYGQTDDESEAASARIIHTIRKGDTLGGLAKKYGTTVSKICKLNGISSKKTLRIGERIIVR